MKISKLFYLSSLLIALPLIGCDNNPDNNEDDGKLNIVENPNPTIDNPGEKIAEDLTLGSLPNDNYRNYYEIFVGSFYDTNNDGIGDLNGVTTKLSYIKDLGYTGIWLMPIFESNTTHKYDAVNYYQIDSDYGTMDDLKNLINECHKLDIKLIIDLAINHCSFQNELFIDSASSYNKYLNNEILSNEENLNKDLFSFSETKLNSNYTQVPGYDFFVEENFQGGGMPEFNFESDYTISVIKDIIEYYLNLGIDGFRLDAVKYYKINDTEFNISILNELYNYAKSINNDVYMVGEVWDNRNLISDYYESNIDSFFYFDASTSSNSFITKSINLDGQLRSTYLTGLTNLVNTSKDHIPAPFLDNHDMSRVANGNLENTKFYYGLLSMLNGTTFTYYGDEIALNGSVPSDSNVRTYMNWDKGEFEGKCNTYLPKTDSYLAPSVREQLSDTNSVLNYYKKANLLRNQNEEIARGNILESSMDIEDSKITVINKEYQDSTISIVINFSSLEYQTYDFSNTSFNEVVGQLTTDNRMYIGKLDNKKIVIPPQGIALLK